MIGGYPKVKRAFIYMENPVRTIMISNPESISKELHHIGLKNIFSIKGLGMLGIRNITSFTTGFEVSNMQFFCYPIDESDVY